MEHQHCPNTQGPTTLPRSWQPTEAKPYPTNSFLVPAAQAVLAHSTQPGGKPIAVESSMLDVCLLVPETLHGLLQNHPDLIHEQGFNGQTLLHRAVLSAKPEAVQILLEHGSDPNVPNRHAETPLHFACKRGAPFVFHALHKAGGRVDVVDNSGKHLVHHAAHAGSVAMMHYLTEVHGLSLQTLDKDRQSPLHISCQHGHQEAVVYLLKKERSNLKQTNTMGDTALHVAARLGHSLSCWKLLEQGGASLLHLRNNDGYTPADLAGQNKQVRYEPVKKVLEHYTRHLQNGKLRSADGPGWVWWVLLFLPFVLYGATVSLALYWDWHAALIMVVGMAVTLTICGQQSHRMNHLSRWPNPMFMGMFGAGLSHSIISYYVKLLPILLEHNRLSAYISVVYAVLLLVMYYKLLTKDPGVVTTSDLKPSGECYTIMDIATGVKSLESFCKSCEIIPPARTKHCKLCERCFVDMDHHCLFLYRCVARHTHRLFVRFIVAVMGAQCLLEYYFCRLILTQYPDETGLFGISFWSVLHYESWVWSLMLTNLASILWGCTLLHFQLSVVSLGHTSYFNPSFGRCRLSRLQRIMNALYFLLGKRPFAVNPVAPHRHESERR